MLRGVWAALRHWPLILRSSWIGAALGASPGVGVIGDRLGRLRIGGRNCRATRKSSEPGDIRGVIAPESSNNAKDGGALIPTVTLGVPGSAGMALVLAAFVIHGMTPGPEMLKSHLDLTYMLVWGLVVANIVGAGVCLAFTP